MDPGDGSAPLVSIGLLSLLSAATGTRLGMELIRKFTPLLLAILYSENFIQVTDKTVKTGVSRSPARSCSQTFSVPLASSPKSTETYC